MRQSLPFPSSSPFSLSQPAALTRACARDGTAGAGWRACPATPHPNQPTRGPVRKGECPLLPLLVTLKGRWQPLVAGHITVPGNSTNGSTSCPSLPLRRLDRAPIPPGPSPSCKPRLSWGFPPFLCFASVGKEKRGSGGREKEGRRGKPRTAMLPVRQDRSTSVVEGSQSCCRTGRMSTSSRAGSGALPRTPTLSRLRQAGHAYTIAPT
jgi:hypothetical protein